MSFVCKYRGQPIPNITWFYNNIPIEDGEMYHVIPGVNESTLMIPEVFPEDAGTYTVKASNDYGEIVSSCVLDVLGNLV